MGVTEAKAPIAVGDVAPGVKYKVENRDQWRMINMDEDANNEDNKNGCDFYMVLRQATARSKHV